MEETVKLMKSLEGDFESYLCFNHAYGFRRSVEFSIKGEQKKVSMIRKYHNHILQFKTQHREEEPQNIYSNNTSGSCRNVIHAHYAIGEHQ